MNIDKSKLYFETDRLIIRLFKPSDASQIVENYKDKVILKTYQIFHTLIL
jgi:hypothetical protein